MARPAYDRAIRTRRPSNREHGEPDRASPGPAAPAALGPQAILALQRAAGNRAVGALLQRTSLVIGTKENDPMVQGALGGIAAPNSIFAFDAKGEKDDRTEQALRKSYGDKGTDTTRLNLIAHGSPGRMEALKDLDTVFTPVTGRFKDYFTGEVNKVDLYTCWAMTKRDVENESVAMQIAKAIQAAAGAEQRVKLRAGYTPNTTAEFAAGRPSYQAVTTKTTLEAAEIQAWFIHHLASQGKPGRKPPPKGEPREDYDNARHGYESDLSEGADAAAKAILAKLPQAQPTTEPPRDPAVEMDVSRAQPLDARLGQQRLTAVSATARNHADFARRLAAAIGWPEGAGEIASILGAEADKLVRENAEWFGAQETGGGFQAATGFAFTGFPTPSGGFTFGEAPATAPQPATGLTFTGFGGFTFGATQEEKKSGGPTDQ